VILLTVYWCHLLGSGKSNSMELLFLQLAKNLLACHEIQWFNHCILKTPPSVTTEPDLKSVEGGGPIVCIILPFVNALHFSGEWLAHCPTPKWEDNILPALPTADWILHGYPTYLNTITCTCNFRMCHACHWLSQPLRVVSHISHMPYTCVPCIIWSSKGPHIWQECTTIYSKIGRV
jgi:hypothetical protein